MAEKSEIRLTDRKRINECTKEELLDVLKARKIEVLITLGAGDIDNYVPQIYELLKDR